MSTTKPNSTAASKKTEPQLEVHKTLNDFLDVVPSNHRDTVVEAYEGKWRSRVLVGCVPFNQFASMGLTYIEPIDAKKYYDISFIVCGQTLQRMTWKAKQGSAASSEPESEDYINWEKFKARMQFLQQQKGRQATVNHAGAGHKLETSPALTKSTWPLLSRKLKNSD